MPTTPESVIPIELTNEQIPLDSVDRSAIAAYVVNWRNQLRQARVDKVNIWNECWQLYRGVEDWSDKDEWMSKIMLPKPWAVVKQATSTIRRLLATAKNPWGLEPYNPDDQVLAIRAEKQSKITKVFLEKANYLGEFAEGLECGFIMGVGIWKLWWGLTPRLSTRVQPMSGHPDMPPGYGGGGGKQVIQEETLEGQLFIKAVDPYKFFWLPGSKLNKWVGTIEDVETPKWQLTELAEAGVFPADIVKKLQPMKLDETQRQTMLRFNERPTPVNGPSSETGMVKITEYFGPLIIDSVMIERNAHIIIGNDSEVLLAQPNQFWHRKAPYVGFTPLSIPFRTEGVGLIEMTRAITKAMSKLANMSIDTLMFKLSPIMEINLDAYENVEDFETGLIPGKLLRRNMSSMGQQAISPVPFEDISQGSIAVAAQLDRAAQEGSLVSEIMQGIPRFRGAQTATEIDAKQANQDSFFGAMAADIEETALKPIIEMANDLVFQFIDTATDPRVASILGMDAQILRAIPKEELIEMIAGDYTIKVSGITDQLEKAEMLQNLVQFMNILGQNAQAWFPYINSDALLRRIMESFKPAIRDIEQIIAEPAVAEARKLAYQAEQVMPQVLQMAPQLLQQRQQQAQMEAQMEAQANEPVA